MALSDDEQEMLNLIAERMYQEDPQLAASLATNSSERTDRRRAGLGTLLFLLGLGLLILAVSSQTIPLGPIGFLVALVGAVITYSGLPSHRKPQL